MCGLFGWYLKTDTTVGIPERTALAAILSLKNDDRGGDSWGYWTPWDAPRRGLFHMVSSVSSVELAEQRVLLAHTRLATQGDIKKRNCHPFTRGPITGAHNGVIYNAWDLDRRYPTRRCLVDSEHIWCQMVENKSLKELRGYGALVYTDTRTPGAVYLGRFASGTLAVAELEGGAGIVWSSALEALVSACNAAGLAFRILDIQPGRWFVVNNGELQRCRRRIKIQCEYTHFYMHKTGGLTANGTRTSTSTSTGKRHLSEWSLA